MNAARVRLLNPTSTAAVVLGAHDWTEAGLSRAPSFLRSARGVVAYLYNSAGLGLDAELVLDLFDDPAGAGDQLARVRDTLDVLLRDRRDAGHPVSDVLIYYVGHGHTDDEGHLSLLVRRSRRGLEAETGIRAPDLARTLRLAAPQQRRSVILDCCFSEAAAKAFIGMASDLNQQVAATVVKDLGDDQPARGTLLLCSSPIGQISMGAPNSQHTLFTGTVLDVLLHGAEGWPAILSFADLRDAAFERMVVSFGANAPRPALHQVNAAQGDLTRAPAFPNRASAGAGPQARSPASPPFIANGARRQPNRPEPDQRPAMPTTSPDLERSVQPGDTADRTAAVAPSAAGNTPLVRRRHPLAWAFSILSVASLGLLITWAFFIWPSSIFALFDAKAPISMATAEKMPGEADMVLVPDGHFMMGASVAETTREHVADWAAVWERPQHDVQIQSFLLAQHAVTRGEFAKFVAETNYHAPGCDVISIANHALNSTASWQNPGFAQTDQHPVVCVNYNDAEAYIEWYSRKKGRTYRLPSEAEWEYAARAQTTTSRYWGDSSAGQCDNANGADLSWKEMFANGGAAAECKDGYVYTAPVSSFRPNPWGLYDMFGNVAEWTADCWNESYAGAPSDGSPWATGDCYRRVLRGGSWANHPNELRAAQRGWNSPADRANTYGFRIARILD